MLLLHVDPQSPKRIYIISNISPAVVDIVMQHMLIVIFSLSQEKPKMGTMESLKFLVSSRYIRDLATLVVAYGISINLVEVTWKSKLKAQVN